MYFLDAYIESGEPVYPEDQLIIAARLLIKPLLEKTYEKKASPVDNEILKLIVSRLFDNPENTSELYNLVIKLHFCLHLSKNVHKLRDTAFNL